jgi:phage baseplate assembly protein gpV
VQDGKADGVATAHGVEQVVTLTPSGAPIFSLAVDGAAPASDAIPLDARQQVIMPYSARGAAVVCEQHLFLVTIDRCPDLGHGQV